MAFKKFVFLILVFAAGIIKAEKVINVPCIGDDQIGIIQQALVKASFFKGENVRIKLEPTVYHLHRNRASQYKYNISNTTSAEENPDPRKHIGIWIRDLENVTFDGNGATLLTYGEMTTFVIDNCKNVKLTNFKLDAFDPSVVEIVITKTGEKTIEFNILPPTQFSVKDNMFFFKGEGWIFGDEGRLTNYEAIAQIYDPDNDVTLRTPSPIKGYKKAEKTGDNSVKLYFDHAPKVKTGERYQLRHSIRNEVCAFINDSKDVEVTNVDFNFLGNFGIVSQFTENVTFDRIHCEPSEESGRTNAGFADFLQFSSCKGLLKILNSSFSGSHDDPINIHGTHLQIVDTISPNKIIVEYRHPQTFGFLPFKNGDEIAFVNRSNLNYEGLTATVDSVEPIDDYRYEVLLNQNLSSLIEGELNNNYVVENMSWTPNVEIRGNHFSRTPTRAILITTRGKSLIEDNTFYHIPMASILVADDANSWYESGPVTDLTIRNNVFVECKSPVIYVSPEIKEFNKPVHSNISIVGNKFLGVRPGVIDINASENILIKRNSFFDFRNKKIPEDKLIVLDKVINCKIEGNRFNTKGLKSPYPVNSEESK